MAVVRGYRPALDGVRAIAILPVMAYHFQTHAFRAGGLGVDVFFALSGYLITGLLVNEHSMSGSIRLRDFYLRRALRLLPALIMLLVVGGIVADLVLGPRVRRLEIGGLIALLYLTDIVSYTHATVWTTYIWTWSLAMEEHFYLAWPGLLLWARRSPPRLTRVTYGLVVVTLALAEITARNGVGGFAPITYYQPQAHAVCLMLGCGAAVTAVPSWFRHLASPALMAIVLLDIFSPHIVDATFLRFSVPGVAISTVILLLALEHSPTIVTAVLSFAPIRRIGVISYGLYLYHPLIYPVLQKEYHSSHRGLVLLAFVVSIAVAEVSYRFYEAPIRRFGRDRMGTRGSRRADSPATS